MLHCLELQSLLFSLGREEVMFPLFGSLHLGEVAGSRR